MRHTLGRIVSPPDARDWKLENFIADDATLRDQAEALLKGTVRGYKDSRYPNPPTPSSNWAKAFALLAQIQGTTPPPPPPPPPTPPNAADWKDPDKPLDQGDTGTCVGNGCAQWGNTDPFEDHWLEADARSIYLDATALYYGAPDTTLQKGCDVRSGIKVLQARGKLTSYASASTTSAITAWLKTKGPVVVGVDWYNDMFDPDKNGLVVPTGGIAGGHCFLLVGVDDAAGVYHCLNSWGTAWGLAGYFRIKVADFAKLLSEQGEAWAALEV